MPRYLNGATIMSTPTPLTLEIAREAGYAGIEARAERLLDDPVEVRATATRVGSGEIWSLNGVRIPLRSDGTLDRGQLDADLAARLPVCGVIGAAYLLAVPPRLAGMTEADARAGIRAGLEIARDAASRTEVGLAFEFLGFSDCPIGTPDAAARVVDGLDGVELVLDSCHWHASGSPPLDAFPVTRLAMVHLNDAPAMPLRDIEDADRVLPGLGAIDLRGLVAALRTLQYTGPFSLETFNPTYWDEDPTTVARQGAAALAALLGPDR